MRMGEGARGRAAASRSRRVRSAGEIWPPEGRELGGELRAEGMDSGEIVAKVAVGGRSLDEGDVDGDGPMAEQRRDLRKNTGVWSASPRLIASLLREPTKKELSRKFSRNCSSAQGAIPRVQTWIHGSSVKEFKLHNIAIFHTNYASSRFDPI